MKVAELEIGCLCKIKDREDLCIEALEGKIDIFISPLRRAQLSPRSSFFVYLGRKKNEVSGYQRMVLWDGKILPIWGTSWQHVEKCS